MVMQSDRWSHKAYAYAHNVRPQSLDALLALTPADLARCDVARVNLLCAQGLPGAEDLDIDRCLATLDEWTDAIRRYTDAGLDRFRRDPLADGSDGHEGVFRFVMMVTLLKHPRGLGIRYQPTAIGNFDFSDSRDDLIHGLLTRRLGTCASLPVLFVAIGRRLGYPMHLALAKRHFICQWVNADGGRQNLEGSGPGGGHSHPDAFYHHQPYPMTAADLASGRYLRPLPRREELAAALEVRGHCLTDNYRCTEARTAYRQAHRVAPAFVRLDRHLKKVDEHGAARRYVCRPGSVAIVSRRVYVVKTNDLHYP